MQAYVEEDLESYLASRNAAVPEYPLEASQAAPMHTRLLALEEGTLCGAVNLEPLNSLPREWRLAVLVPSGSELIAQTLLEAALEIARSMNATGLRGEARSESWLEQFYRANGFAETERVFDSILELANIDLERLLPSTPQADVRIETPAAHLHDEVLLRAHHTLVLEVLNDIPPAGNAAEWLFEAWLEDQVHDSTALPEAQFIALRGGEPVGLTQLTASPLPGVLETGLTGVRAAHRRSGIAFALKLEAIRYALAHGAHTIRTSSHDSNTPMRHLNARLGFNDQAARLKLRLTL